MDEVADGEWFPQIVGNPAKRVKAITLVGQTYENKPSTALAHPPPLNLPKNQQLSDSTIWN